MFSEYFGLANVDENKGWAVMSSDIHDPNPPILVFESAAAAEKYRLSLKLSGEWQIAPHPDDATIEEFAERAGNRLMLVTSAEPGGITTHEISYEELASRDARKEFEKT